MAKRFFIALYLLLACVSMVAAQQLQKCPLAIKDAAQAQVGILVRDIITGDVVVDVNSESTFVPASITKALTTASVLSQMLTDMTFSTECFIEGEVNDTTLNGNIVVKCCSDPTLNSKHFASYQGVCDSIVAHLQQIGVRYIKGDILFDFPPMAYDKVPAGWMNDDLLQTYGAAHYPLNFNDNHVVVNLVDGSFTPSSPKLVVKRVEGSKVKRSRDNEYLYIGANAKGRRTIANPNPKATFDGVLADKCSEAGIKFGRNKIARSSNQRKLYTHVSPTYEQIMRSLMFRSDNLMAEGMLRTLAPTLSRNAACQREMSLWEARGLNTSHIFVEDGSGLSRKNRISPRFLSDVLQWMIDSPDGNTYLNFFPLSGRSGTMKKLYVGTPLDGRLALKTGTMRRVRCFAGYMLDMEGAPTHTVVVMVNAYTCGKDQLDTAIGDYLMEKLNLSSDTTTVI